MSRTGGAASDDNAGDRRAGPRAAGTRGPGTRPSQGASGGAREGTARTERRAPVVPRQGDSGRRGGSLDATLDAVLRRVLGPGRHRVLDLIEVLRGHGVHGLDAVRVTGEMFPKLAHDGSLSRALVAVREALRPGGVLVAAVPELERLQALRTAAGPPRVTRSGDDRELTVQVWDWSADGESYGLDVLRLTCENGRWELRDVTTAHHRVLTGSQTGASLRQAGFGAISRLTQAQTGHRMPVWVAYAPEVAR